MRALFAAALLLAAPATAQTRCAGAAADTVPARIRYAVPAAPARIAPLVDTALTRWGYRAAPGGPQWSAEDRFDWIPGLLVEKWHSAAHPGDRSRVTLVRRGDSTDVVVETRVLCVADGAADQIVEDYTATLIAVSIGELLGRAGLVTWVGKSFEIDPPGEVGAFHFVERHDYDDPRLGTQLRYQHRGGRTLDLYVYPGPPATPACPRLCSHAQVELETAGFLGETPEYIRRGYYQRLEATGNVELTPVPSDPWRAGRHVTLSATRDGREMESHFYLFALPGFMLKVRATAPPDPAAAGEVAEFVRQIIPKLLRHID